MGKMRVVSCIRTASQSYPLDATSERYTNIILPAWCSWSENARRLGKQFQPKGPYKLVLGATQTNLDRLDIYINTSLGKPRYVSAGSVIV
jgi:hypothetical protein